MKLQTVSIYDLDGKLTDIISLLQGFMNEVYPSFTNLRLEVDWYYDDLTITLFGDRAKTSEELAAEKTKAQAAREKKLREKQAQEEAERAQLAQLLKKYPDMGANKNVGES